MKHLRLAALVGAITFLGIAPVTWAQTAAPQTTAPQSVESVLGNLRYFRMENVPPSLMAHWLAPDNNAMPPQLAGMANQKTPAGNLYSPRPNKTGAAGIPLPASVGRIFPVDEHNLLAVEIGNAKDETGVRELITVLDQPLRQVEIEMQLVEMSAADSRTFGIDFSEGNSDRDQVGFVRNNFIARLNALIADNRAKLITAPRVTAINKMTATLANRESRPLIVGNQLTVSEKVQQINITPTINGDDTITLALTTSVRPAPKDAETSDATIAYVRDGDTIAIKSPVFASKMQADSPDVAVAFLTARIIRRAGEKMPKPKQ